jgi:hypothetical protein
MKQYDPEEAPDPAEWLKLDEQLRIMLCEEHHRRTGAEAPNLEAHAVFHAIIENQIAERYEPVVRAMARLCSEGLSRHEAVHAVASVLAEHLVEASKAGKKEAVDVMKVRYPAAVGRLTKKRWLDG